MNLTTERCIIRSFAEDDWQDVYAYTSDPEVMKYIPEGVFLKKMRRNLLKIIVLKQPRILLFY